MEHLLQQLGYYCILFIVIIFIVIEARQCASVLAHSEPAKFPPE